MGSLACEGLMLRKVLGAWSARKQKLCPPIPPVPNVSYALL